MQEKLCACLSRRGGRRRNRCHVLGVGCGLCQGFCFVEQVSLSGQLFGSRVKQTVGARILWSIIRCTYSWALRLTVSLTASTAALTPVQGFDLVALPMGEDVKGAAEGIEFERLFNEDAQAVYRLAKVYGLPAEVDLLYLATRVHQYAPWLAWFRAAPHAGVGSDEARIREQFVARVPAAESLLMTISNGL
jgi:hypothetical protein